MFIDLGISIATEIVWLVIHYEVDGFSSTHGEKGSLHTPACTHQNVQDFGYKFSFCKKKHPFFACCYAAYAQILLYMPLSSVGQVARPSSSRVVVHPRHTFFGFSQASAWFSLSSEERDFMPAVAYSPDLVREDVLVAAHLNCRVCLVCDIELSSLSVSLSAMQS